MTAWANTKGFPPNKTDANGQSLVSGFDPISTSHQLTYLLQFIVDHLLATL